MSSSLLDLQALLRADLLAFIEKSFAEVYPGERFLRSQHIEAIVHQLLDIHRGEQRRLIVNQPPRSLKSMIVSVGYVAWLLGQRPQTRIIVASYSAELASEFHGHFRRVVRSSWYRATFPRMVVSRETDSAVVTTMGGGRWTASVGGTLTGRGADLFIIDDPMKAEDAWSEAARRRVIEWFTGTVLSRLNKKNSGAIIVVMQRLHEEDLSGYLLEKGGWGHLCLPAIATRNEDIPLEGGFLYRRRVGEALHPARESLSTLAGLKSDLGSLFFEAQYQQSPVPLEGNLFQRPWFGWIDAIREREPNSKILQSWDTASVPGTSNDCSVGTTWYATPNHVDLIGVERGRWDFPTLRKRVIDSALRWNADTVLIEESAGGSGIALLQDLRNDPDLAIPYPIGRKPVGSKEERAAAQSARFEGGMVSILRGAPWVDDYLHELLAFPHGRHDDQVDATTQALEWWWEWRRNAGPVAIGIPISFPGSGWKY